MNSPLDNFFPVSSLKLAPKGDSFHASCPGNMDKVLQHKTDLDRDVQAAPQSRCHLTGKFHHDLRSAVFTPACCGLTLGGQIRSLSPLRLQLSHHLVAEALQIIKTLHSPVPHGGVFNFLFCLLIRLLVLWGKHQAELLYSCHFLLQPLCLHVKKGFLLLIHRRQEPWINPWVVLASRGKWACSQRGISHTNLWYPKLRNWCLSHCWLLHSAKRGWTPQQADHVRNILFEKTLGAVRAGLGGCPHLLGLPWSHTSSGTALGHAG